MVKRLLPSLVCAIAAVANAAAPIDLKDALDRPDLHCELSMSAVDRMTFVVTNSGAEAVSIAIPAGAIGAGAEGTAKVIVLQTATLDIAPLATGEALLPVALLSSKLSPPGKAVRFSEESEPRLERLLKRLASEKDVPRATAQFAIFGILEDMNFGAWQKFLAAHRGPEPDPQPHPNPVEIVQAIDALGLIREVAPERKFALMEDGELKLRALRNPWCRAKAMQLYGIKVTDDGSEFGLPNISQLLHTKPGDNCPVCRNREEMKKGASDF